MKILRFLKGSPVLCVAAIAALISCLAVPPSLAYAGYIDWRVIFLLFCLMTCVSGLAAEGVFGAVGRAVLGKCPTMRKAALALVGFCFFSSMLVTNDVALITFVPLAVYVFELGGRKDALAVVVVLQTIAANLGSMVTPMGNPQNLFLFEAYELGIWDVVSCTAPFALLSGAMLAVLTFVLVPRGSFEAQRLKGGEQGADSPTCRPRQTVVFAVLFIVSTLAVCNIVPLPVAVVATIVCSVVINPRMLAKVDYSLLLTFVCFFIFSGNLSNIACIRDALTELMTNAPFAASLVASQALSNVPSAILLAPFTDSWHSLLLGVDLGGLGTPVASLASLISLEFYRRAHVGEMSRYLAVFTALNVAVLFADIVFGVVFGLL